MVSVTRCLLVAILVVCIAVYFGTQQKKPYLPWHENPEWQAYLQLYDEIASEQFAGCTSHSIATSFGSTQVHACGDPTNPPVLLLPGAASNSLLYAEWLSASLQATHYTLSADFVCDIGRSVPRNGDPANCPQTEQQLAEWVKQILSQLNLSQASIIGYSYGSFIAACTALYSPESVDRVIFIAPAAVFAPIEFGWIWRAIVYGMMPTNGTQQWFFQYMSAEPDFDLKQMTKRELDQTILARKLAATVLTVQTRAFEEEELAQIAKQHKALMIVGEQETVINSTVASQAANKAGIMVKMYPRSGHLLVMEYPRESVQKEVASFLKS